MNTLGTNAVTEQPMDDVERVTLEPRVIVGLRQRVTVAELSGFFARAIPAVAGELARAGTRPTGPPVTVYRNEEAGHFDVTVGFPVTDAPAFITALVREVLPGGPAVRALHVGSYETLSQTYAGLSHWFNRRRLLPPDMMWEEYLAGPGSVDESEYLTRVVYPLR
ncbi:AraC family transcriptional regulator [Actinoplanes sp. ATCC 53533]|uniref:GyrI-like domain-containing protein n=1 Tax=Actinoplanes sp. ATCC 53533 TaxID=1288362 RepID=UPI000F7687DD|nr:GyrI-like domain-containing protein [Actinoplanes sp. ATCC 53533]RSM68030.1 AraC family transcriptional regulator [Actinoplanes sp. ATCC 53533]